MGEEREKCISLGIKHDQTIHEPRAFGGLLEGINGTLTRCWGNQTALKNGGQRIPRFLLGQSIEVLETHITFANHHAGGQHLNTGMAGRKDLKVGHRLRKLVLRLPGS